MISHTDPYPGMRTGRRGHPHDVMPTRQWFWFAYNDGTMSSRQPTTTAHHTTPGRIRSQVITGQFVAVLREHGVTEAYLFGSVARGDERPDSDIDLLVTFQPGVEPGQQFLLAEALSTLTKRRVDVATNLHPAFAPLIRPTLVPIPL